MYKPLMGGFKGFVPPDHSETLEKAGKVNVCNY